VKKTRAYRPQTNGKAERFIRTLLERWAYAYSYEHESQRLAALPAALDFYNRFRPHRALGGLAPLQRVNNLSGTYNWPTGRWLDTAVGPQIVCTRWNLVPRGETARCGKNHCSVCRWETHENPRIRQSIVRLVGGSSSGVSS